MSSIHSLAIELVCLLSLWTLSNIFMNSKRKLELVVVPGPQTTSAQRRRIEERNLEQKKRDEIRFVWKVCRFSIMTTILFLHHVNAKIYYENCVQPIWSNWLFDFIGCQQMLAWEGTYITTFVSIATMSVSVDVYGMMMAPTMENSIESWNHMLCEVKGVLENLSK